MLDAPRHRRLCEVFAAGEFLRDCSGSPLDSVRNLFDEIRLHPGLAALIDATLQDEHEQEEAIVIRRMLDLVVPSDEEEERARLTYQIDLLMGLVPQERIVLTAVLDATVRVVLPQHAFYAGLDKLSHEMSCIALSECVAQFVLLQDPSGQRNEHTRRWTMCDSRRVVSPHGKPGGYDGDMGVAARDEMERLDRVPRRIIATPFGAGFYGRSYRVNHDIVRRISGFSSGIIDAAFWKAFGGKVAAAGSSALYGARTPMSPQQLSRAESVRREFRVIDRSEAPADIDLFLVDGRSMAEGVRLALDIAAWISKTVHDKLYPTNGSHTYAMVTNNALSLQIIDSRGKDFIVQVIFRSYRSVAEVLHSFDISPCKMAFDGGRFYMTPSAKYSLANGVMVPDVTKHSTPSRAWKYWKRGFTTIVPRLPAYDDAVHELEVVSNDDLLSIMRKGGLQSILALRQLRHNDQARVVRSRMREDDEQSPAIVSGHIGIQRALWLLKNRPESMSVSDRQNTLAFKNNVPSHMEIDEEPVPPDSGRPSEKLMRALKDPSRWKIRSPAERMVDMTGVDYYTGAPLAHAAHAAHAARAAHAVLHGMPQEDAQSIQRAGSRSSARAFPGRSRRSGRSGAMVSIAHKLLAYCRSLHGP